jgi:hypothetical protein
LRSNTKYFLKSKKKEEEKPSLPLIFLHIWQARNISFQQDNKKTTCGIYYLLLLCSASPTQWIKNI